MVGRFEEARELHAAVRKLLTDQAAMLNLAIITSFIGVPIELLAEDYAAALDLAREGCRLFERASERGYLSSAAGNLAAALYALDQLDEAQVEAARAGELGSSDDADSQMLSRRVQAKVCARRGDHTHGERLAREAVAIADQTDYLNARGDAYADFAEVLALGGKPDQAKASLHEALDRYDRKGNLVMSRRIRERLTPTPGTAG
jgi:hypothetical protein